MSIKEIELENKIAKESEQSNKIKEFKIQNNLKFTVKTKEIELKGRYAKEKELSTVIEELKINNEKLKHTNEILQRRSIVEPNEEVKVLKEINTRYQNEIKSVNIIAAKDESEFNEIIKSKNVEIVEIKNTHDILKDLYEKKSDKHYNLLEYKEMLEEFIQNNEKEMKKRNCDKCEKVFKINADLKTHRLSQLR